MNNFVRRVNVCLEMFIFSASIICDLSQHW